MLQVALQAAGELAGEGIEAEVIDLRTLRPLDTRPIVASAQRTNRVVIVEEGWRAYGVGAEIASRVTELAFDHLDAPIRRVAQAEVPLPYNRRLEQMALPQVENVVEAVKDVLYRA
jgi:pyruvate dehydrogenase E1 component beta subunit